MDSGNIPSSEQDTNSTPSPVESSSSSPSQRTNPKKPLLKFVKKITQNKKKSSGGCEEWVCMLCNHVFKGSYTRVWHHLLCIAGDGVKGCTCNVEKRMELTKLHMDATGVCETNLNNDRPFKIPRVLSSSNDV